MNARRRMVSGAGAALIAFAAVAGLVQLNWLSSWDRAVFSRLYSGESGWAMGATTGRGNELLQALLPWCSRAAAARNLVLLVAAGLVLLVILRWSRGALLFGASVAVVLLSSPLKHAFGRPSPFPLPDDPSFPSGHATLSMAIAAASVAIVLGTRASWLVVPCAAALVIAVGIAAVADGGHWPSDVAGGWCIALAWVLAVRAVISGPLRASASQADQARRSRQGIAHDTQAPA